ncbi:type II 3-dehydroquinate dehydratase [Halodesulfovibrio sp.]|jgi:3-dehydroquinate dehydratase-2|uniref:type II 3-dehydroquinate dehydratase n=1 Tax=Halodesulfovibrio sp. TaxID=1912772 RepID=UPI0025E0F8DA|nr:type II 3-dehydroquinate dehydratase [Halodesulfovibrio sp.]MCT4534858.1 3-dehydroquinate dehydratase [Halodesulfovibrio sp.]MCT4627829.1 3-dehydroquinate dehydratase [Halodesulfovibrio sp.]
MAGYKFLILNGPNLGALGKRQPEIYGNNTMDILPELVQQVLGKNSQSVSLELYQNNSEGKLIDRIEQAREEGIDGIVFNAGAYTHTSLALADCLAWIELPVVEVHLSNVLARSEPLRQKSLIGRHVIGAIAGFGMMSYALAVQALFQHLEY